MMFITTFVYVLEVATVLLVGLTVFQVHRCYKAFNQKALSSSVSSLSSSEIKPSAYSINKPLSAPESILHDYIGEFFMGSSPETVANIDAYKVNDSHVAKEVAVKEVSATVREMDNFPEKTESSNVVSFDERSDNTKRLEILVEEEDDSVITVMTNSKSASGSSSENVMSDKVVHAMLDEAKLVCVS